jgi:hypothetical protein
MGKVKIGYVFLKITNLEKFRYLLKNKDLFTDLKPGTANRQK